MALMAHQQDLFALMMVLFGLIMYASYQRTNGIDYR
jgi:hypothetical protein